MPVVRRTRNTRQWRHQHWRRQWASSASLLLALFVGHSCAQVVASAEPVASLSSSDSPRGPHEGERRQLEETCQGSQADGDQADRELCALQLDQVRRKQQHQRNETERQQEAPLEASALFGRHAALARQVHQLEPRGGDAQSWRYQYFEEQDKSFRVRLIEGSLDERLANVIYTLVSTRAANIDFLTYNSGDPLEDALNMDLAAGPQVDEARCARHLDGMLALLDEIGAKLAHKRANASSPPLHFDERHFRLTRVLDSYGRYEAGHLSGKQHSSGQWEQCTSTHLLLGGQGDRELPEEVGSTFCWARMSLDKHLNENLRGRVKGNFEAAEHPLMVGICLPRSCHSKTFAANKERIQRLVDSQFRLPRSLYLEETLPLDSVYCPVDRESAHASLPLAGKLAVAFLLGWLALAAHATTSSAKSPPGPLDCLNLRKSWLEFVGQPTEGGPEERARLESQARQRKVELDTLNPVKAIGCAFVVLGHAIILRITVAQNGLRAMRMVESDPLVLAVLVGTLVVDTFFVISGILMGYVVMRRANRKSPEASKVAAVSSVAGEGSEANGSRGPATDGQGEAKQRRPKESLARLFATQWLKFAVSRHLRLVPLFFLVFWLKKSVAINYLSTWPLWDAGFNKDTSYGACRLESWLTPFSVMAAFLPLSRQCVPQAWSVASDLFFSLTIPPIMLAMPRRPKLALAMGACLTVLSNFWALGAYYSVDPHMRHEIDDLRAHGFASMFGGLHHLYTYPHFRFCSILVGLMAGYFLYKFGEQTDELKQWPRWFAGRATWAAWLSLFVIIVGFSNIPSLKYYIAPYHKLIIANLFTVGRALWALCNAVIFMRMASDWRHSFLMQTFSGRFWQSVVKLNLATLLIHMDVLFYFLASATTLGYLGRQSILSDFGIGYFYCFPLAVFLHVVFENPMDKLAKRHVMPRLFAQ